jgi:conjugal transfer pilus assembly protein TraF
MPILYRFFSVACLITLTLVPCYAQEGAGFYEKSRQGFYWYEKYLSPEDEEAFDQPDADAFTYNDLWMLNSEKFKIVLKDRFNLAIQAPTEENVYRYIEIQDVAKRKSMAFAGVMGMVSQQNPQFQGKGITTMTNEGRKAYYRLKNEHRDEVLRNGRDEFALIVFESPGCGYCEAQRPIVEAFQERNGWSVKYLDIYENENLAEKYSIDMTPTIMMLTRSSKELIHISKGVVSMAELRSRISRAIRYISGETKAEQWFNGPGSLDPLKLIHQGRGQQ